MKKLYFRYSAMNAGKSMHLIMTYYNYKELGLNPIALIPDVVDSLFIKSRVGSTIKAHKFSTLMVPFLDPFMDIDCVLVDEAQFLNKEEIEYLLKASIERDIPVICYGLRTTSTGELFEGSKYLLGWADIIEELPTLCRCGNKGRFNLRIVNGKIDKSNEIVKLREDQEVAYISVCKKCYLKYFLNDFNIGNLLDYDNTKNCKEDK